MSRKLRLERAYLNNICYLRTGMSSFLIYVSVMIVFSKYYKYLVLLESQVYSVMKITSSRGKYILTRRQELVRCSLDIILTKRFFYIAG